MALLSERTNRTRCCVPRGKFTRSKLMKCGVHDAEEEAEVGEVVAEGRWVSGRKRVFVAESRLVDAEGDEIGRGTGTFMRSHIPLSSLPGYLANP